MKNLKRIAYGLIMVLIIYGIAEYFGHKFQLKSEFAPYTFVIHSIMLVFSVITIVIMRKKIDYKISLPDIKRIFKPIILGIVVTIGTGFVMGIITKLTGGKIDVHPAISKMTPLQILIFVFIYASLAEELLFRGFLMNYLKPLKVLGFNLFKCRISLPVIISAVAFGLAHLILIRSGVGTNFLVTVVLSTTFVGIVAGYYQEKYDNNSYAIIVHMAANSITTIAAFLMTINV